MDRTLRDCKMEEDQPTDFSVMMDRPATSAHPRRGRSAGRSESTHCPRGAPAANNLVTDDSNNATDNLYGRKSFIYTLSLLVIEPNQSTDINPNHNEITGRYKNG